MSLKNNQRKDILKDKARSASFKKTLNTVQAAMPQYQRTFSRFLHFRPIEVISDILASIIFRPYATAFGVIIATIYMLLSYVYSLYVGFPFSGPEVLVVFLVGWIIGLLFELFRIMISGKR